MRTGAASSAPLTVAGATFVGVGAWSKLLIWANSASHGLSVGKRIFLRCLLSRLCLSSEQFDVWCLHFMLKLHRHEL